MSKTLYFEGAGTFRDEYGDLGNCRIRTCFADDSGHVLYLEVLGWDMPASWRKFHPEFKGVPLVASVDSLHEVTGDPDDCNARRLPQERAANFPYNRAHLLEFVNSLGCSFDSVEVLPRLAGYGVHAGFNEYRRGDLFAPDWEKTRRAEQIEREEYQAQRDDGEKHPCVSVWRDSNDPAVLHIHHPRAAFRDRNRTVRL